MSWCFSAPQTSSLDRTWLWKIQVWKTRKTMIRHVIFFGKRLVPRVFLTGDRKPCFLGIPQPVLNCGTCVITFPQKTTKRLEPDRCTRMEKEKHRHKPPTCGLHVSFPGCNLFLFIIFATLRGFEDLNLNGYSISTTLEFSPRRININTHFIPWTTSPNRRWWVQQRLTSKNTYTLELFLSR